MNSHSDDELQINPCGQYDLCDCGTWHVEWANLTHDEAVNVVRVLHDAFAPVPEEPEPPNEDRFSDPEE